MRKVANEVERHATSLPDKVLVTAPWLRKQAKSLASADQSVHFLGHTNLTRRPKKICSSLQASSQDSPFSNKRSGQALHCPCCSQSWQHTRGSCRHRGVGRTHRSFDTARQPRIRSPGRLSSSSATIGRNTAQIFCCEAYFSYLLSSTQFKHSTFIG